MDDLVRSAYRVREPMWSEAAAVGGQAWVEGVAERILVGRRAVGPVAAPPAAAVAEEEATYALRVSRRAFEPLRDGLP